jgi:hypothetical protein
MLMELDFTTPSMYFVSTLEVLQLAHNVHGRLTEPIHGTSNVLVIQRILLSVQDCTDILQVPTMVQFTGATHPAMALLFIVALTEAIHGLNTPSLPKFRCKTDGTVTRSLLQRMKQEISLHPGLA